MENWLKHYLMPLLLVALFIALYFDSRSVVTVEPQSGRYEPVGRDAQPQPTQRVALRSGSRLAVGERYGSLDELVADQRATGFVRTGYFGKHWPATVVEILMDDDGIRFVRRNGTPHNYTGFTGYRMKMVRLDAPGGEETIVVFRSEGKR